MLDTPILNFVLDTENPVVNYECGYWYEFQGHYAPALTYYLRAAERTDDVNFSYVCLVRGFYAYEKQGNRDVTAKSLLYQALCILPKRPEAYFLLSKYYENKGEWMHSYSFACLGLECCDFSKTYDHTIPEYPGIHGLIFQKAISGYWWGKGSETRQLLQHLVNDYWNVLDDSYKKIIENNIINLGVGPKEVAYVQYDKFKYNRLKFKFDQCENIDKNYSQTYQDMFVLSAFNGKNNGTYLEIGGGDPFWGNNTALLETKYNWSGVSVEINQEHVNNHKQYRKHTILETDATKIDYKKLLKEHFSTNIIDYLQLDCDPTKTTFDILLSIPFEDYKFGVITYEHDYTIDVSRSYREKSRRYLSSMGYKLLVNDIGPTDWFSFEDWWVHPDIINPDIILNMQSNTDKINQIETYFLTN